MLVLGRGKNRNTRRKTSLSKEKKQQTQPTWDTEGRGERGKPEYPEKNLSEQGKEATNSAHTRRRIGESKPDLIGGRRVLNDVREKSHFFSCCYPPSKMAFSGQGQRSSFQKARKVIVNKTGVSYFSFFWDRGSRSRGGAKRYWKMLTKPLLKTQLDNTFYRVSSSWPRPQWKL